MRRIVLVLVAINAALFALGAILAPAAPARGLGRRVKVGLVFDVGGRGDRSFNDAAARGLERAAADLGADVTTIEPGAGADRETALRQLAARGSDLVIGVGFIFSNDLDRLAGDFPGVRFAGVDYAPTPGRAIAPNLRALTFREHEAAFVVGAIAGLVTRSRIVGFVGGMQIPLIRKFEAGYTAGVHHVCPACQVLAVYAGNEPKAFADPARGRDLATAQYDRGADVIFHAAGKTGDGVFAAAREHGAKAIGVDSDQYDQAPCCIVASMVKRVDVAVYDAIRAVQDGSFQGGMHELGMVDEGVGYVARDDRLLPPAVRAQVDALARDVVARRIQVPSQ